jgi:hypothetical protein
MKAKQKSIQAELSALVQHHLSLMEDLKAQEEKLLQTKADPESWSALECIEHLCRYGDFYLPEVRRSLKNAKRVKPQNFKSSWLGEYFAQSMWPKQGFKTMNTFKSMNPQYSGLRAEVLLEFEEQLKQWQSILNQSSDYSWQKVKTGISISKFIKLRLGDTLRVVFYHNHRHLLQAFRAAGLPTDGF